MRNSIIFIFILVILGSFFRFYQLDKEPYWMDEGYTINAVLSVQEKGSTLLDSGNYYRCPTYCYPTAFIVKYFGNNAFSYRLLAAIAGIIFIVLIFYITKRFFGQIVGFLASAAISLSYWQIAWSRQARWYTLFALFFWLAILFFYESLKAEHRSKKIWLLLGASLFTIVACLTHGLGYLLPFVFITWYLIEKIFIKKDFQLKKIIFYISTGITFLFLFFVLDNLLNINFLKSLFNNIDLNFTLPYHLSFLFRNYWLFIIFAFFALCTKQKENTLTRYFLLFIFLAYLIPLSFLTDLIQYRYLFHITPIIIVLGILGMYDIYLLINKKWQRILFVGILIFIFFTYAGGVVYPKERYPLESDTFASVGKRAYYPYTPQPDWNKAYEFIKSNKKDSDVVISSLPHFNKIFLGIPGYWIKYNYLGLTGRESKVVNNKEFYVGAEVLNNLEEVQSFTKKNHGYIIFDFMATNNRIDPIIIQYIRDSFKSVFFNRIGSYSEVWVYKF